MCINEIIISDYAKNHYIKNFKNKYKKAWDITFDFIENMLLRIESFLITDKAEKIHICDNGYIVKCYFKIAGSNQSAKNSGNRLIAYIDTYDKIANILLVYDKNNVKGNHETVWWEQEIKNNHKDVAKLFDGLK